MNDQLTASSRELGLSRKAFQALWFRAAALPLGFATTVVTSRFLLPEGRGAYVIGLLTVTLAASLLSIGTSVIHELGKSENVHDVVLRRGLVVSVALGTVLGALLIVVNRQFAGEYPAVQLFALGLPGMLLEQVTAGALLALGRLRTWNLMQLLRPLIILIGLVAFVIQADWGVSGAVAGWVVAQWTIAVVGLGLTHDLWWPRTDRLGLMRAWPLIRLAFGAGMVTLVSVLNYRVALLALERMRGLESAGVYSLSMSLAELLWLLSSTLTMVTVAPAIRTAEGRAVEIVAQAVRHAFILTGVFGALLCGIGALTIPLIFGEPFRGAVTPLALLIPGIIAYSPCSVLSMYFSMRHGKTRFPVRAAGLSAIITAVCCLVLVPPFGTSGAAIASSTGFSVGALSLCIAFVRSSGATWNSLLPGLADATDYADLARAVRRSS